MSASSWYSPNGTTKMFEKSFVVSFLRFKFHAFGSPELYRWNAPPIFGFPISFFDSSEPSARVRSSGFFGLDRNLGPNPGFKVEVVWLAAGLILYLCRTHAGKHKASRRNFPVRCCMYRMYACT